MRICFLVWKINELQSMGKNDNNDKEKKIMEDIVKHELELNTKELKRCIDKIIPFAETTEEIVKLNFESIRLLVDYCEHLSIEGESAIEKWLTSPRLAKLKENRKK